MERGEPRARLSCFGLYNECDAASDQAGEDHSPASPERFISIPRELTVPVSGSAMKRKRSLNFLFSFLLPIDEAVRRGVRELA